MNNLLDDATTVFVLRNLRPKLVGWTLIFSVALTNSLIGALISGGLWSHLFSGLAGASAALLGHCLARLRRVDRALRDIEP